MTTFTFKKNFVKNLKIEVLGIDKRCFLCYDCIMNNELKVNTIPSKVAQEADNLSKETGIPFRDCLEVLYKASLNAQSIREDNVPKRNAFALSI